MTELEQRLQELRDAIDTWNANPDRPFTAKFTEPQGAFMVGGFSTDRAVTWVPPELYEPMMRLMTTAGSASTDPVSPPKCEPL